MKYWTVLSLTLLTLVLTACSTRSPSANFYLLQNDLSSTEHTGDVRIGLGPVSIADYLQKPQIAIRTNSSMIIFSEFERWASDLRGLIINALRHDLANQLNTDNVFEYPWRKSDQINYALELDIKRLDASFVQSSAYLEAHLKLTHSDGKSLAKSFSLTQPIEGAGYEAAVSAERALLTSLSAEIAQLIQKQQSQ